MQTISQNGLERLRKMANIVSNFDQILDFAKKMEVPVEKKRGIVREYLQAKFIAILYSLPKANKLSFVGGTSLRLLHNLNRFSEDLDFDNLGLSTMEVGALINEVSRRFKAEGIELELRSQNTENKAYFDIRFLHLLEELKITTNPKEKLMIKFDYSSFWQGQSSKPVLFNKYGFIENIITNNLDQLMVQKLTAYVHRNITQPRDLYDVVWLYAKGARVDLKFAQANNLLNVVQDALVKFTSEGMSNSFKTKLQPFLFNPNDVRKLDLFEDVLKKLSSNET